MGYSLPFFFGGIGWAIFCNKCNREAHIDGVSIMTKWFGPTPSFCIYCGSKDIIVETSGSLKAE